MKLYSHFFCSHLLVPRLSIETRCKERRVVKPGVVSSENQGETDMKIIKKEKRQNRESRRQMVTEEGRKD